MLSTVFYDKVYLTKLTREEFHESHQDIAQ